MINTRKALNCVVVFEQKAQRRIIKKSRSGVDKSFGPQLIAEVWIVFSKKSRFRVGPTIHLEKQLCGELTENKKRYKLWILEIKVARLFLP